MEERVSSATGTVRDTSLCDRTPQVRDAIVAGISGVNACELVTAAHLASLGRLSIFFKRTLTSLAPGDFAGLTSLVTLDLPSNALNDIPAGTFSGLTSLTGLDLSGNMLISIPADLGAQLPSLENLTLNNNQIASVSSAELANLDRLSVLDLNDNDITAIGAGVFSELGDTLTVLSLNAKSEGTNVISTLPPGALSGLRNLTQLALSDHDFSTLPVDLFSDLVSLQQLFLLRNSNLTSLPAGLLAPLTNLTTLNLGSGGLTSFDFAHLERLRNLTTLILPGTPNFAVPYELVVIREEVVEGSRTATLQLRLPSYVPEAVRIATANKANLSITSGSATLSAPQKGSNTDITVTQTGTAPVTISALVSDTPVAASGITVGAATPVTVFSTNIPARGQPQVTGSLRVGRTLAIDLSDVADADGLPSPLGATYQWQRSANANFSGAPADIDSATAATYTLADDDANAYIRVRVNFSDSALNSESLTSAITAVIGVRENRTATGVLRVQGSAVVGELLTASFSAIMDDDGLQDPLEVTYQWQRSSTADFSGRPTDIAGATEATYTVTATDENSYIRVVIAFTDTAGFSERLVSEPVRSGEVANTLATGVPRIEGTPAVSEELTAVTADIADGDGLGTFSYQWHRGASASFVPTAGTAITAARGINTYQLVEGDFDAYLLVVVTFTDQNGFSERLISQTTAQIEGNINRPAAGQLVVTGVLDVGQILTADTTGIADRDGLPEDINDYSYQWQRSQLLSFDMASTTAIPGAGESSYTLVDADAGHHIRVVVSFTDGRNFPEELISAPTSSRVVARPNQSDTGEFELVGTAKVGSDLTVAMSDITDPDGLPTPLLLAYRWHRGSSSGFTPSTRTALPGETGPSYILQSVDQGRYIRVVVRFTDSRGFIEKRTSTAVLPSQFNFCDRTSGMQQFVLSNLAASLGSVAPSACSGVTLSHLSRIGALDIGSAGNPLSSSLTSTDFIGLTALRRLSIVLADSMTTLPDDLFQTVLGQLTDLQLTVSSSSSNPSPLSALPQLRSSSLQRLDITGFPSLTSFPAGFFDGLTELVSLNLSGNGLTDLGDGLFGGLTELTQLQLQDNNLASLPNLIFNSLERLSNLDLSENRLIRLPPNIFSRLASLATLNLAGNGLVGLPPGIFDRKILLESLDLSSNALTSVPLVSLANLPRLTALDLSFNPTEEAPISFPIPLRLIRTDSDGILTGRRASELLTRTARVSLPAFVPLALRQPVSLSAVSAEITFLDSSTLITEVALDTEFRVTKIASDPDPTVLVSPAITDVQKGMRIVATGAVPLFSTDNRAATGAAAIVGEAALDEVLRATQGTVSDPDGVPSPFEAGASYQWYRGGNRSFTPGATAPPIGTSPTYQVTPLDVGRYLRVRVIFVDALGNRETSLSPATDRVKEVVNTDATGQPAITGSDSTTEGVEFTYFGATLAAERGTITDVVNGLSDDPFVATYQWQRSTNSAFDNPIPITDARSATYTLDGSEISAGEYIRVQVNFADASGFSEELVSAPLLVAETDLCLRTAQVVERITQQIGGSPPCLQVTVANLAGITELDLSNQQITSLQRGDLAGLTQVSRIAIGGGASADAAENNSLSTLPAGLFSGSGNLTGLTTLVIAT